jgi:hypothetical protein
MALTRAEQAEQYVYGGLVLVPIPPNSKAPKSQGWNELENAFTDPARAKAFFEQNPQHNMGLLHFASNTAALDIDHRDHALTALHAVGIDLTQLEQDNPFKIKGKNGEKPLYRVPEGLLLHPVKLTLPALNGSEAITVLELRGGSVQDVLPPSIHPDTQKPYAWVGDGGCPQSLQDLIEIPDSLLEVWQNWPKYKAVMLAALGVVKPAPTVPAKTAKPAPSSVPRTQQATDQPTPIEAYNARYTVHELLERNGYKQDGAKYIAPSSSTGMAGVTILRGDDGRDYAFSHHGSDPIADGHRHDAFDLYKILEHGGDDTAAVKAAALELGLHNPKKQSSSKTQPPAGTTNNPLEQQAEPSSQAFESSTYFISGGAHHYWKAVKQKGETTFEEVRLCNFVARIESVIIKDDGANRTTNYAITGKLATGRQLPAVTVPTGQYRSLNWVHNEWGAFGAQPMPGLAIADHLQYALHQSSYALGVKEETRFGHLGWTKLVNSETLEPMGWAYLHAGGAITSSGLDPSVSVELTGNLSKYILPAPLEGQALRLALEASFNLLKIAPDHVGYACYMAIFRAALGDCNLTIWLQGKTGSRKSAFASVLQAHFGTGFKVMDDFGESWKSTANHLELSSFRVKDSLLFVDDFKPEGTKFEMDGMYGKAAYFIRGQGNQSGRQRLDNNSQSRGGYYPRGIAFVTAEENPKGNSGQGRCVLLHLAKDAVNLELLTAAQKQIPTGIFAGMMAAYLQWLAPKIEQIQAARADELGELRPFFREEDAHARNDSNLSELYRGAWYMTLFALEVGAITEAERWAMLEQSYKALRTVGSLQAQNNTEHDPMNLFTAQLTALLATGKVHLLERSTLAQPQSEPERWGWKLEHDGNYYRSGDQIGWMDSDGGRVYLQPEPAYAAVVQSFARENETFPMTKNSLIKELADKKISLTDPPRGGRKFNSLSVRIGGATKPLLCLPIEKFGGGTDSVQLTQPNPKNHIPTTLEGGFVFPKIHTIEKPSTPTLEEIETNAQPQLEPTTPAQPEPLLIPPPKITQPETKPLETIAEWGDD